MTFPPGRFLTAALLLVAVSAATPSAPAAPAGSDTPVPPSLTSAQIVEQMRLHNDARTRALKHWKALRHYKVEYRGFNADVTAAMEVEAEYDPDSGKTFRIVSQTGSKFICDKVIKRAVESEREASLDKGATAITSANYTFRLEGTDTFAGRPSYVLSVEPIAPSKFLYRGKIWVDAADFAVAKIEAQPAKNPSFLISQALIHYTSAKTGDFWFPQFNRSESKVRIGGTAVLTIDYGAYQVSPMTLPR